LGFVLEDGTVRVGSLAPTLMESGCKFCTACVAVCPTGALMDKDPQHGRQRREMLKLVYTRILPPEPWRELSAAQVEAVPEVEGVYQLYDKAHEVLQIKGVPDLRRALKAHLEEPGKARYFSYEPEPMYTQRESELLQQYLQQHGRLPGDELDELEDLF
jgi:ferredoxin